ncbi:DUF4037 domain-containing protein [Streptomyces rubiginosohelvolus]
MTTPARAFLPGLELSRILYEEAVRPVLDAEFPGLRYAAARVGPGSEVLGFDTARSADHEWGPRLDLFLRPADGDAHGGYPEQVWRYLLACQWQRISQEEAFVGRCAEVGDDLGSAVVAGRLVRDLMRLCLLLEREYAPYGKWLGSAFARLPGAGDLLPSLRGVVTAGDYATRERHLCDAYERVAAAQNRTGLTEEVDPTRRRYHSRPFQVLHAERFAHALARTVTDPDLRDLPLTGGVDQWADSTDFLGRPEAVRAAVDALG